ncbi:MAG TPA: metabolite traffic protein EboE [Planctomycetota bacterium]|nr:metabolite traffic protein EboE [Planctomycetota bacterium]
MILRGPGPELRLGYCTNVHPAETLAEVEAALDAHAVPLRRRLLGSSGSPLGLGLYISRASVDELFSSRGRLEAFRAFLESRGLFVFTLNAFPYGGFHAPRVKEEVFRPTWAERSRLTYTLAAAAVLARLLPAGARGSVSTHTGSFKPWGNSEAERRAIALAFAEAASALSRLRDSTGTEIVLSLEPEPFSTSETSDELVAFFRGEILGLPDGERRRATLFDAPRAEEAVRRFLGVCFDTGHLAVQFEDLPAAAEVFRRAGVRIGKVQISNALEVPDPGENGEGRAALQRFDEPRYLHQVVGRLPHGGRIRSLDLGGVANPSPEWLAADAWRSHVHVPIHLDAIGRLRTTRAELEAAVEGVVREGLCDHLEIETYTWDVLPSAGRGTAAGEGLVDSLEREFRFALEVLGRLGYRPA